MYWGGMMKRFLIQLLNSIAINGYVQGFLRSTIYKGDTKVVCVPGLNCYSCPGAVASCPIGALQSVLGSRKFNFSFYILGFIMGFGILFARLICGFLCPFGFLQDLLYKVKVKKINVAEKIDKPLRYLKYVILLLFVIIFPLILTNKYGSAPPYFCQYICPVGTLQGGIPLVIGNEFLRNMIGWLFSWKMFILLMVILASTFIYRPFCKYLCPLGAIYALFNKVSFYRLKVNHDTCINCMRCETTCKMQVKVLQNPNHGECIRCGDCIKVCPVDAIEREKVFSKNVEEKSYM
jgi:polyferredoxin